MRSRRPRGESGNVAVLFGVMLVAIFGIGTLAIDVGGLYVEGRQLQNGAENAALTVAQSCATDASACEPTAATALADELVDSNVNDGVGAETVCGTAGTLAACSDTGEQRPRFDCMPESGTAEYVEVRSTNDGAADEVPALFSRVLGFDGTSVGACARAAFGAPAGLTSQLPITISLCEWYDYTANGTDFAPPPPYPPYPSPEAVLYFHETASAEEAPGCSYDAEGNVVPPGPSGADMPGGFGWLDTDENCVTTTDADGWADNKTGVSAPSSCDDSELRAMLGQIVYIPIFDGTNGLTGSNLDYHIRGYAAFYLTGYYFPGGAWREKSLVTGEYPCNGSSHCISGFFTEALAPASGPIGGPSMGVTVIALTG